MGSARLTYFSSLFSLCKIVNIVLNDYEGFCSLFDVHNVFAVPYLCLYLFSKSILLYHTAVTQEEERKDQLMFSEKI